MDWVRDYIVFHKGKEYKNCVSIESAETMYSDNNYEGACYINEYEEKLLVKILYINEKGKLCYIEGDAEEFIFIKKPEVIICND